MIRTPTEEPCTGCGRTTNAYDVLMGRLCPQCIARRCAEFSKGLEAYLGDKPILDLTVSEGEIEQRLAPSLRYLLSEPSIKHERKKGNPLGETRHGKLS